MRESGKKIFKSSSGVALATLISRALGLFRVILEAGVLGGGVLASAWHLAFMVPNMFRRFLGEGALGTAMVPMVSHAIEKEGKTETRRQLTAIFFVLGLVLAVTILLVAAAALVLRQWVTQEYSMLALDFIPLLMPYAFFMCFVGVVCSVLNSIKVFFLPALGALSLNIAIIGCLLWIIPIYAHDFRSILRYLSYAVAIAGAFQLVLMLVLLWMKGMFPMRIESLNKGVEVVKELWRLVLPGLIGASALQFSFLTDRLIAAFIGPYAVPSLTYCDRIVYLPISIFALSLGSVLLPNMSRSAAREDYKELFSHLRMSLRWLVYICVPIAVFTVLFRVPLLRLLYLRGAFDEKSLQETAWAMLFYACGIPFFTTTKILVQAFYARKDMKTPLKISLFCIALNLVLNLSLMAWLRQGGIALATVIASITNNSLLLWMLHRHFKGHDMKLERLLPEFSRSLLISGILAAGLYLAYPLLQFKINIRWIPVDLVPLTISGIAFCTLYLLGTILAGSPTPKGIASVFRR